MVEDRDVWRCWKPRTFPRQTTKHASQLREVNYKSDFVQKISKNINFIKNEISCPKVSAFR